jgi:transposase
MAKQHDQKFKEDAVAYYNTHKDLGFKGCATNIGIRYSTLQKC